MHTNRKHFARNPLEICLLCFCCIIFVYLLNTSKQVQESQETIIHQYLTFAGYAIRTSFETAPIISPDHIIWDAETPFLEEEARLQNIIELSMKQLEEGIIPEGADKDAKPVPLGENQRLFVGQRIEDATIEMSQITAQRMIAVTKAEKARDQELKDIVQGRYRTLLADLNSLFEMMGPFFFVYYAEDEELYTASSASEEDRLDVLRLLETRKTVSPTAYISVIDLDNNIQLGAYMPANYNNPIVLDIIRNSIPLIVLILVFPCVVCSFFASSFLRAHKQKELAHRIKRATHLVKDFADEDEWGSKKKQRKRYHEFKTDTAVEMALYGASADRASLYSQGSLADSPLQDDYKDGQYIRKTAKQALDQDQQGSLEINMPRNVLYGALWVENFLSLKTTPIRKQLDRHTNIPNRTMFLQMLQELWIKKGYLHAPIFLAHLDVDDLEQANNLLGYTAGNTIINGIINILSKNLGKSGAIGRLSSDNFICIYVGSKHDFDTILKTTLTEINDMVFDGRAVHKPSASIGVTDIRETDRNVDEAQKRAISALYRAKNDGKNCFRVM